jgi:hypothetical protein
VGEGFGYFEDCLYENPSSFLYLTLSLGSTRAGAWDQVNHFRGVSRGDELPLESGVGDGYLWQGEDYTGTLTVITGNTYFLLTFSRYVDPPEPLKENALALAEIILDQMELLLR